MGSFFSKQNDDTCLIRTGRAGALQCPNIIGIKLFGSRARAPIKINAAVALVQLLCCVRSKPVRLMTRNKFGALSSLSLSFVPGEIVAMMPFG